MRETPKRGALTRWPRLIGVLAAAAGGLVPSAVSAEPVLVIDARADPGIELLVTFVPQSDVDNGSRRVAAHQSVVTTAQLRLSAALPASWMVSVLKKGDVAANVSTTPLSDGTGYSVFVFPNEMNVVFDRGEWQIPNFDSDVYAVEVGFGLGGRLVQPAYAVRCRPGQRLQMASGHYQVVRSEGDDTPGMPIAPDAESWDIPTNAVSVLTFDARGQGTLSPLR